MNTIRLSVSAALAFAGVLVSSVPAQEPPAPPAAGVREFQLKAPSAREVTLRAQWPRGSQPFQRGDDGTWRLSLTEIPPGIWEYSFVVDGVQMIDPANPAIKPMREPRTSILHVPSSPPAPWDWQDVPHGTLHFHPYTTGSGHLRELVVYTPPGYESAATTVYPLLVLQHGSGDNQRTWTDHGKAHWIYDSLIAAGKAVPAVVLMLNGHPEGVDRRNRGAAQVAFLDELSTSALPLVEGRYRVSREPAMRAMAGLSMGGGQTLKQYLRQLRAPETTREGGFGWFGAFSAATPSREDVAAELDGAGGEPGKSLSLWIACGRDDFLLERNLAFREALNGLKLAHEWHLTDGDHSWPVWRKYLADFVPILFRNSGPARETSPAR